MANEIRNKLERSIVRRLIKEVGKAGYVPVKVWDGGEYVEATTTKAAIDAVFSVDESTLHFAKKGEEYNWGSLGVFLIGGNGEDIISDYHCGDDVFRKAVERTCGIIDHLTISV